MPSATTVPATASGSPTTRVRYSSTTGRNKPDPRLSTPSAASNPNRLRVTATPLVNPLTAGAGRCIAAAQLPYLGDA